MVVEIVRFFFLLVFDSRKRNNWLIFVLVALSCSFQSAFCIERLCGEFYSDRYPPRSKGTFEIENYTSGDGFKLNDSLLCIYRFVARHDEKVMLTFNKFDIKSIAPDCVNEYIDVYIEATELTLNNYVETNFLSRWCGWKKPHVLVSYYNVIVFAYHTDGIERGSSFAGTFEFVDARPYNLGRKSHDTCHYEFNSETAESGIVMSPTYPGTYPNSLNCSYKFIGRPDQRVSIYFEEILIHYGADHCPYDSLRVFDYQRSSRDLVAHKSHSSGQKLGKKQLKSSSLSRYLIDTYCGRKVNFTLFSTNNQFEIEFEMSNSLGNEEYAEDENRILLRKGFRARYTFSKYFADLAFITGTHIVGTNCDQRITSQTPTGFIYSPNFLKTFTINASCKYIFEGVNDNYNSESIKLNFYLIDFKPTASNNLCNEESASHFVLQGADSSKAKFCHDRLAKEPKELRSAGSELTLVFNSISYDQYTPSNFKASYTFYTEFRIEGTRIYPNRTCLYTYNSENVIHGSVNSPRYPDSYPLNIKCEYIFDISSRYERILFTFKEFKLWSQSPLTFGCNESQDFLSVYQSSDEFDDQIEVSSNSVLSSSLSKREKPEWQLTNRYCGNALPTPFISDSNVKRLKLVFSSNDAFNAQGFNVNYNYLRIPECRFYFYTSENTSSNQIVITSNDMEATYYCDWLVKADEPEKILLFSFKNHNLEDLRSNQFVIRVYDMMLKSRSSPTNDDVTAATTTAINRLEGDTIVNQPIYEYKIDGGSSLKYFQADTSYVRLQLVIGRSMVFGDGKLIIDWITATKNKPCQPDEFLCNQTGYCIKSMYFCDKFNHCPDDFSDEPENCYVNSTRPQFLFLPFIQITSFAVLIAVLVVFLAFCILCRLKSSMKSSKVKKKGHFNGPPIYYKYSPANSVDYLEAAITSV